MIDSRPWFAASVTGIDSGLLNPTSGFGRYVEAFLPPWIMLVNEQGRRFMSEMAPYAVSGYLINEQTNKTLFILTVVTVLALPLTIIPGMFGMNVRGIPFSENEIGFWLVLLFVTGVVGLGAALAWSRYRR